MFRNIILINEVLFFGKPVVELLQGHKVRLRFSQILILPLSLYFYRIHRAVLPAGRGLSKPVRDGFDGIVAVADRLGAVVQRQPLVKGRVLSRLKGLAAARNLARRNSAREVVDQTSNIRMAFVLNLPDIDVRVVLSQLQMRQQRPITPNNMLTILAVNPPRLDSVAVHALGRLVRQFQQRRRTSMQPGGFSVTHTILKSQISKQPSLKTLMDKLELLES